MTRFVAVADPSFLYAALAASDAHHQDARSRIETLRGIEIPETVLGELELLLRKHYGAQAGKSALESLLAFPWVGVQSPHDPTQAGRLVRDGALTLPDLDGIALALKLRAPLLTYDQVQLEAYEAALAS